MSNDDDPFNRKPLAVKAVDRFGFPISGSDVTASQARVVTLDMWIWVKINPPEKNRRFQSMFSFTRASHFGVTIFLTTTAM